MSSACPKPGPRARRAFPLRPVLPADPPPPTLLLDAPILRTLRTPSDFGRDYIRSTHIFPAAWPRSTPYIPAPASARGPVGAEDKKARRARGTAVMHELIDLKMEHENGTLQETTGKEKVLWICANRYARKRGSVVGKGKTMICTHANGMHKELFEPLLHRLFALRDDVDEVWALDCVQHGDSALLNESSDLGSLFDWSDLTRDVLCFLQHFLPQDLCMPLPTLLERLPTQLAQSRLAEGLAGRAMLALGHSYGGTALALAVRACPVLFDALVLADPVILPPPPVLRQRTYDFLRAFIPGAVVRRNTWESRKAALSAFKTSFMGAWPDEVLQLHVQHGLVDTPAGDVRLKCSGFQEAVVYIEHYGVHEAWIALPDIDERIAIHWIVPPAGQSIVLTEDVAAERVRRRLTNASHVVLPGATHLVIQSHPLEVAEEIHRFMEAQSGNGPHSKARL